MAFNKILNSDLTGKGVVGLPDVPGLSSGDMQEKFDELANYAISRINQLIDELTAATAASNIGYADGSVQVIIDRLLGYASDLTNNKADSNDVIKKDNVAEYTPTGAYNPATKKYVDDKVVEIGAGDMAKAIYDSDGDGVVDKAKDSDMLGGQPMSYFAPLSSLDSHQEDNGNPHSVTKSQVGLGKVNNNSITMSVSGTTLNISYN